MLNLPQMLARWGVLKREMNTLEVNIKREVLLLQKSQEWGGVIARYDSGRGRFDYETIVTEFGASPEIIQKHTENVPAHDEIDWKAICGEVNPDEAFMRKFYTEGKPSVNLKLQNK